VEEEKSNRESLIALLFVIPSPRSRIHERMIPCVCTLLVLRPTQVVVLFITCLNPGTCTTPWVTNNKFRYLINNVFRAHNSDGDFAPKVGVHRCTTGNTCVQVYRGLPCGHRVDEPLFEFRLPQK